jgi:hypothetical protein
MHTFRFAALLGALFLAATACGGTADADGASSASAADTMTATPPPIGAKECFVPSTAVGPGVHELWFLDGTKLERTTASYWKQFIMAIGGDPPVPPSVTLTVEFAENDATTLRYAGTETVAAGSAGRTVAVELTRDAERPWLDLAGTITLSEPGKPDEVITITHGRACQN